LKEHLTEHKFTDDENVVKWLPTRPRATFFYTGVRALEKYWKNAYQLQETMFKKVAKYGVHLLWLTVSGYDVFDCVLIYCSLLLCNTRTNHSRVYKEDNCHVVHIYWGLMEYITIELHQVKIVFMFENN